jgi:hypothetical protein
MGVRVTENVGVEATRDSSFQPAIADKLGKAGFAKRTLAPEPHLPSDKPPPGIGLGGPNCRDR